MGCIDKETRASRVLHNALEVKTRICGIRIRDFSLPFALLSMRQSKLMSHFKPQGPGSARKRLRDSSDDASDVSSDSDVRAVVFEDRSAGPVSANDSGSDNDENAPQPRRSTLLDSSPAKKKRRLANDSSDEDPADAASDVNDSPPRPSGSRKADPIQIVSSDEEEEDRKPRRRKLIRGKRPAAHDSDDNEDEDLQDGLDQRSQLLAITECLNLI